MPEYREDVGYVGQLVSLAGVKGRTSGGIVTTGTVLDLAAAVTLCGPNPRRIWALVQNVSTAGEIIRIQIGLQGAFYVYLNPYGTLLINDNMRWTGALGADSPTPGVTALVRIVEASVDG